MPLPEQKGITTGSWDDTNAPHTLTTSMENLESLATAPWDEATDVIELGSGTRQLDMLQELEFQPVLLTFYSSFDLYVNAPAAQ